MVEEITVTANKKTESLQETPITISTFDGKADLARETGKADIDQEQADENLQRVSSVSAMRKSNSNPLLSSSLARPSTPPPAPQALTQPEIDKALNRIRELLASNKLQAAKAEYQTLVKQCPSCDLPETMEQALEDLKDREQADKNQSATQ